MARATTPIIKAADNAIWEAVIKMTVSFLLKKQMLIIAHTKIPVQVYLLAQIPSLITIASCTNAIQTKEPRTYTTIGARATLTRTRKTITNSFQKMSIRTAYTF